MLVGLTILERIDLYRETLLRSEKGYAQPEEIYREYFSGDEVGGFLVSVGNLDDNVLEVMLHVSIPLSHTLYESTFRAIVEIPHRQLESVYANVLPYVAKGLELIEVDLNNHARVWEFICEQAEICVFLEEYKCMMPMRKMIFPSAGFINEGEDDDTIGISVD